VKETITLLDTCHDPLMDTQTIDQEFEKLQGEFGDVAKSVQALAEKMQAAEKAGDTNATEWLADLKLVAQDIDDEQTQAKVVLLALHSFIAGVAEGEETQGDKPPLFASGHEPTEQQQPQSAPVQQPAMMGGPMLGGLFGGYMGGGFARSMEMGAAMSLGASLVSSIFR
jgi:hypothetical protein